MEEREKNEDEHEEHDTRDAAAWTAGVVRCRDRSGRPDGRVREAVVEGGPHWRHGRGRVGGGRVTGEETSKRLNEEVEAGRITLPPRATARSADPVLATAEAAEATEGGATVDKTGDQSTAPVPGADDGEQEDKNEEIDEGSD